MKKLIIIFFLLLSFLGCNNGGDENPPSSDIPVATGEAFIIDQNNILVDFYWINVNGVREKIEFPLKYNISDFDQGEYVMQIQAIFDGKDDIPLNFVLLVSDYEDGRIYEILPNKRYPDSFSKSGMILEIKTY